jgi:hypothetical protein
MKRFVTFSTYDDEDVRALSQEEFDNLPDGASLDWDEYVWQFAPDKAAAIEQHVTKMDAYQADNEAGREIRHTY